MGCCRKDQYVAQKIRPQSSCPGLGGCAVITRLVPMMPPGGTDPVPEVAAQVEVEAQTVVVGVAVPKAVPRAIRGANPRVASMAVQRNRVAQMMHQEVLD